jgi:integrase
MSIRKRQWTNSRGEKKEAWVVDYVDQGGKRHISTFARRKDADKYESNTKVDVKKGLHVADSVSVTLAQAGALWIKTGETEGLEPTTIEAYRQHLRLHIEPYIGNVKLSQLSAPMVRAFLDKLHCGDTPRSPAMVRKIRTSLSSLIADAQERGLVAQNVVRDLRKAAAREASSRPG